jgi:hypothetical protein
VIILGSALKAAIHNDTSEPSVDIAPSPTQAAAPGPVGSSFDLKDASGNTYRVTLVKVVDPAKGADQFTAPDTGKRFVGLVFKVKAVTGSPQSEDANNDAVVLGGDGQTYKASFDAIAGYTNFDDGAIRTGAVRTHRVVGLPSWLARGTRSAPSAPGSVRDRAEGHVARIDRLPADPSAWMGGRDHVVAAFVDGKRGRRSCWGWSSRGRTDTGVFAYIAR